MPQVFLKCSVIPGYEASHEIPPSSEYTVKDDIFTLVRLTYLQKRCHLLQDFF